MSIALNHTLADLYAQDGDMAGLVGVFAYPTIHTQGTASSPESKKFTYQYPLAPSNYHEHLARFYLHNTPLKMAFLAGKMPVSMLDFHSGDKGDCETRSRHVDAHEILNQLHPDQQPKLAFFSSPDEVKLSPNAEIVSLSPVDRLAHLPHVADPDVHYGLLSKRGLAYSGLPTPHTTVVDSIIGPGEGFCARQAEVQRMLRPVHERELPFIVKLPQAVGGFGTFVLRTAAQREAAVPVLEAELDQMLQSITPLNQHLHTCCLVLQEFVSGKAMGLNLFSTQQGRAIFTGCCTEILDKDGFWAGATISYPKQPELESRFAGLIDQIAGFLHSKRYYGAAGVDVMTDSDGRDLIIDLNVRPTGSYALGCLRDHFTSRGLSEALLYFSNPYCPQGVFREHFKKEFEDGTFVLPTWTSLPGGQSRAVICMAAPDQQKLHALVARVESFISMTKQGVYAI